MEIFMGHINTTDLVDTLHGGMGLLIGGLYLALVNYNGLIELASKD